MEKSIVFENTKNIASLSELNNDDLVKVRGGNPAITAGGALFLLMEAYKWGYEIADNAFKRNAGWS